MNQMERQNHEHYLINNKKPKFLNYYLKIFSLQKINFNIFIINL
jgi:hypothetical protein